MAFQTFTPTELGSLAENKGVKVTRATVPRSATS